MKKFKEIFILLAYVTIFCLCFYLPVGAKRFDNAVLESLHLVKWYAREHVVLCLVPAFFIAGAIAVFVSSASVMKYLGAGANKILAYGVASISGTIIAVCSCTVLPLFAGIYKMGAGIGPASTFLYSGPAINALAIILTARVLGWELGIARAIGAIIFSIVVGIIMELLFRKDEQKRFSAQAQMPPSNESNPLWQSMLFFGLMVAILVSANFSKPVETSGLWYTLYSFKWVATSVWATVFAIVLIVWFRFSFLKIALAAIPPIFFALTFPHLPVLSFSAGMIGLIIITSTGDGAKKEWFNASWDLAKQILPLLLLGVFAAGILLGRPDQEGLIPSRWISASVGGNSLKSNFLASIVGAFMYFATLTEVPILRGLIGAGMGKGPALALLLAGPALSLPNMLVIQSVMGTKKTVSYVSIVVVLSTIAGVVFGAVCTSN